MQIVPETISIKNISAFQSKEPIGTYFTKTNWEKTRNFSQKIEEVIPFDSESKKDLLMLIDRLKAFMSTGYNYQIKLHRVYKQDNKPIREIDTNELQKICNRKFGGKQNTPKVPDFTNYINPKKGK